MATTERSTWVSEPARHAPLPPTSSGFRQRRSRSPIAIVAILVIVAIVAGVFVLGHHSSKPKSPQEVVESRYKGDANAVSKLLGRFNHAYSKSVSDGNALVDASNAYVAEGFIAPGHCAQLWNNDSPNLQFHYTWSPSLDATAKWTDQTGRVPQGRLYELIMQIDVHNRVTGQTFTQSAERHVAISAVDNTAKLFLRCAEAGGRDQASLTEYLTNKPHDFHVRYCSSELSKDGIGVSFDGTIDSARYQMNVSLTYHGPGDYQIAVDPLVSPNSAFLLTLSPPSGQQGDQLLVGTVHMTSPTAGSIDGAFVTIAANPPDRVVGNWDCLSGSS